MTWWWALLGDENGLVETAWWGRLDEDVLIGTAWWWGRLGDEDGLMVRTAWWWERLGGGDDLLVRWMGTIYLPTLNWADKEFFLIFLYIASLGQAWQNPSDINPRVGLRAVITPTRSDTNPRVGFKLLSETQPYGQANCTYKINRYKMSLLIISDQTKLHTNFYVAFCFMSREKMNDYFWALNQLKTLYARLKLSRSIVFVIDMKKDLMTARYLIFFDSNHLLCI
jgi:hypothetical protein